MSGPSTGVHLHSDHGLRDRNIQAPKPGGVVAENAHDNSQSQSLTGDSSSGSPADSSKKTFGRTPDGTGESRPVPFFFFFNSNILNDCPNTRWPYI